jgi:hypothetical protein
MRAKLLGILGGRRDPDLDVLQSLLFLASERDCPEGNAELHDLAERYRRLPYGQSGKTNPTDVAAFNAELAKILDKINLSAESG